MAKQVCFICKGKFGLISYTRKIPEGGVFKECRVCSKKCQKKKLSMWRING